MLFRLFTVSITQNSSDIVDDARRAWRTALAEAAGAGSVADLRRLLGERPDGESIDSTAPGRGKATALMLASWGARREATEFLLMLGGDPFRRASDGRSAQNYATDRKRGRERFVSEAAALLESYAGGRPAPRLYRVRLRLPQNQFAEVKSRQYARVSGDVASSLWAHLSLKASWAKDNREATLWLLSGEPMRADYAVKAAIGDRTMFRYEVAPVEQTGADAG